jgi:DNA-binding transcriptional regulator YhcF (GntR family)
MSRRKIDYNEFTLASLYLADDKPLRELAKGLKIHFTTISHKLQLLKDTNPEIYKQIEKKIEQQRKKGFREKREKGC